jgi:surface protein
MQAMFAESTINEITGLSNLNTSNVTNMSYMFFKTEGNADIKLSNWNTSSVKDISYINFESNKLELDDILAWDTSKVEKIEGLFNKVSIEGNLDLTELEVDSLTDITGLQQLTIDSWLLATRWSEIQSNAVKIASDFGVNKTDFSTWAYQKYRQLQEMHITCRSWHRSAKEDYRANQILEGQI